MCNPLAIVGAGISVVGGVLKHKAASDAYNANKGAAIADAVRAYGDINERETEESKAASNAKLAGNIQGLTAIGVAQAAAAGAGVSGQSVDLLLHQIQGDTVKYADSIQENLELSTAQLERQKLAVQAGDESRINSVQKPSVVGTALGIGGSVLGYYSDYMLRKPNPPASTSP